MKTHPELMIPLRTGNLHISTEPANIPLRRLLGFSSRINSKRGYLLISKVLGKHYPVTPRTMAWSYRALAKRLLEKTEFSEPSLWIGMAETATGLGYGVYEAASALGIRDALFMQTSRYHISGIQRLEFIEEHSHATDFFLYWPKKDSYRKLFLNARQLVLIDDEISTGTTFARLINAYRLVNPQLEKVLIVSLVNFASLEHRHCVEISAEIPIQWISLIEGRASFDSVATQPDQFHDDTINVIGNGLCKQAILAWPGRLGIDQPISFSEQSISKLLTFLSAAEDLRPILVLGTGECNPPAYILGRALERRGYPVIIQATTRSPIFVEGDIASRIRFTDNYQDRIHNFLYNIHQDDFRQIVFCHETPLIQESTVGDISFIDAIKKLNGISAQFSYQDNTTDAELHFCRP